MSSSTVNPGWTDPRLGASEASELQQTFNRMWWLWLVTGIFWIVASLVILQFNHASLTAIGIIIGVMFIVSACQQFVLAATVDRLRWLWILFGVLFLVCGIICFANPTKTFAGLADVLGFLFLVVGVWWTIGAFLARDASPVWWLGLVSGILMIIMAFWTSGQFFLHRAYILLVFAGIWALMHGVGDIVRAFQARSARDAI